MNKFVDLYFCVTIVFMEILAIVGFALAIQGIIYQISNKKINLYKIINKKLEG